MASLDQEDDSTSEDSMESGVSMYYLSIPEMSLIMRCVLQYEGPRVVTISSLTETGQAESTIPVLKQRSYTARFCVLIIPSALANTPCANLGVIEFVRNLNAALWTSYTADEVHPALNSILDFYKGQNCDFGTAYAHFRNAGSGAPAINLRGLRDDEEEDRKMRQDALGDGRITNSNVLPRRVWDLQANRVVPYWVVKSSYICGISHAWMDDKDRVSVMTPINGYEWPVPIQRTSTLI